MRTILATAVLLFSASTCSHALSGGSIPVGGPRGILGCITLPGGPAAGIPVLLSVLRTGQVLATTTTDSTGTFTVDSLPTGDDVEVVATAPGATVKAIVSYDALNNGTAPLSIGAVSASTTVAAAAIELEIVQAPDTTPQIVATQLGPLSSEVSKEGQTGAVQSQEIGDTGFLQAQAKTVITSAANTELTTLSVTNASTDATAALQGLLGHLRVVEGYQVSLASDKQAALITSQIQSQAFGSGTVATALQQGGIFGVSAAGVLTGSLLQRSNLPALGRFGPSISAFESLAITVSQPNLLGVLPAPPTVDNCLYYLVG